MIYEIEMTQFLEAISPGRSARSAFSQLPSNALKTGGQIFLGNVAPNKIFANKELSRKDTDPMKEMGDGGRG